MRSPGDDDALSPSARVHLVRASDAERDSTIGALREHCAQGRLTLEEFAERLDVVLQARTRAELDHVTADLPVARLEPVPPARVAAARSGTRPAQRGARRRFIAILGRSARGRGRWRVPERADALAVLGECELDLREAVFDGDVIDIVAVAVLGQVSITVPEGMRVEVEGLAFLGENEYRVDERAELPGMPVLHLRSYPILGEVSVRSRPRRPGRDLTSGPS